jgi:hypothetical protein
MIFNRCLAIMLLTVVVALPAWSASVADPIGSGDGRIHVIPSIAPYSVKNGETLTVTAVIRSERPVASVTANLGGVATSSADCWTQWIVYTDVTPPTYTTSNAMGSPNSGTDVGGGLPVDLSTFGVE